jgi:flavin reductase (DIM6/NTAB) family NADH-FMN oxidoreductase RutF
MKKSNLGAQVPVFPMAVTLVGANVDGKPNFLTVVWSCIVNFQPPLIGVVLYKTHYTNKGIHQNKTFSVNIPSADMVGLTDYCSMISGRDTDKSTIFETFYGSLKTAPMISQCPISLECQLKETGEFATHEIFIGEIISTYTEQKYITNEVLDITKVNPIIYSMYDNNYWRLGENIGKAFHIGKMLDRKQEKPK